MSRPGTRRAKMRRILVVLLVVVSFGAHAAEAPDNVDGAMTVNVFQAKRLHELGAVFIDVRADREWLWGMWKAPYISI